MSNFRMLMLCFGFSCLVLTGRPRAEAQVSTASGATVGRVPSAPQVYDLPTKGAPSTNVLIQGAGFDPLTAIDVYFDDSKLASTTTDKNGGFGNGVVTATGATFTRIQVPANALPGQHTITAQERVGQKSAQKSFLVQTDWPQFRFDAQHTGFNSYENVLSPASVKNLIVDWKYTSTQPVLGDPAVVNGVVYFTSNKYPDAGLVAVDAATGALLWKNADGEGFRTPPVVVNGIVYIAQQTPNGGIYAFNAATGVPLWNDPSYYGGSVGPVVDNVLYGSNDGGLLALSPSTGATLWTYPVDGAVQTPAVYNGVVYFNSIKFIYPTTYINVLYAVDFTTHQLVWQHQWTTDGAFINPPVVDNGVVLFNSYAFDAQTGTQLWNVQMFSTPAAANGVVYVGCSYGFCALDVKTGEQLWSAGTTTFWNAMPTVANGVVYVESDDGNFNALDAATGAFLWQYNISTWNVSGAAVADGVVYVGTFNNALYAFHLPNTDNSNQSSSAHRPDALELTPVGNLQAGSASTSIRK